MECFRKWKKKVEILFKGLLSNANDPVKCNYIIYWSGEIGMELVDKWETEGKSLMPTETKLTGISHFLKSTLHPNPMP